MQQGQSINFNSSAIETILHPLSRVWFIKKMHVRAITNTCTCIAKCTYVRRRTHVSAQGKRIKMIATFLSRRSVPALPLRQDDS